MQRRIPSHHMLARWKIFVLTLVILCINLATLFTKNQRSTQNERPLEVGLMRNSLSRNRITISYRGASSELPVAPHLKGKKLCRTYSKIDLDDLWKRAPPEWKQLPAHVRAELENNLRDPQGYRDRIDMVNRVIRRRFIKNATALRKGNLLMCRIRMDKKKRNVDDIGPFGRAAIVDGIETTHPQYFTEAMILLVQHNEQGSIGLILNRFSQFKLGEVTKGETLSQFSQSRLFLGGDTANGALTVLHDIENIPGAVEIRPGINLGGDAEGIQQAVLQQRANVSDFKWIMNQCGWPSGQVILTNRNGGVIFSLNSCVLFQSLRRKLRKAFGTIWMRQMT